MMSATAHQSASTTTEDASESGLPAFTTFQATDLETSWDYYERVVAHPNADLAAQAANYTRPWEMESKEHQQQQQQQQQQLQQQQQQQRGFEPFPKLPSFQSQFHSFADNNLVPEPSLPTQVTAVPVPISPSSGSPSGGSLTQLTQLTPSPLTTLQPTLTTLPQPNFHTLATIPVQTTRSYPLVPAPIQARDIPSIQQQYIDERHIQLYQPITTAATFHHPAPPQPHQGIVTVLKNEQVHFDIKNGHHTSFQGSPMDNGSFMDSSIMSTPKHSNKSLNGTPTSHNVKETRKKERRKIRASSLESSTESDASSAMDIDGNSSGNPGQVAAVSSSDNFKSPMHMDNGDHSTSTSEKQAKQKKRKRCGECVGCQKKDNCGECAPCRNDKSHQICKQRRCEKLTEKKIIYSADGTIVRGESRRGRGKGRGGTSYRGRKALNLGGVVSPRAKQSQKASNSPQPAAVPQQSPNTISSQPGIQQQTNLIGVTTTPNLPQQPQQQSQQQIPSTTTQIMKEHHQQPMTPMAFYPAWQTTATAATTDHAWQNQFIQQIPQNGNAPSAVSASTIAPLNSLEFQQGYAYPANGYVQTTGLQFDPNYSRTATTYSSPTIQRYEFQAQQIAPINQVSLQSVSFAPNVTYSQIASPAVLLNHQQHQSPYHQQHELINKPMTMSATLTTSSGNDMPGYPRVNSVPPRSLNCSGYPGLSEYGGNSINTTSSMAQQTNTSSSLTTQMHPPLTQSPSSQPSRPGSSNQMYQQQSPSHFSSPTSQAQSPSINGNSYQTEGQQDWNQNSWNGNASQPSDIFNQSDRINLNTRLKTMILHKSDKDQQQQQPGNHFLSHSHQHLNEQQQQLANSSVLNNNNNNSTKSNNNNSSNETKQLSEEGAGDVGGFDRSPVMKQDKDEIKSKDFFEQKQQLMEKNSDPGGGGGIEAKQSNFSNESVEREAPLPPPSSAESKDDRNDRQSYSYHSAHEYQQHKNMVNNIKKEACDGETPPPPGGNVKFEGYEKNYQNFIRYADFCDAQQPQSYESPHPKPTTPYQQDYMPSQGYYNNYPYQNYGPPGQNYAQQHSQSYQQFMSQQHSSLTNFEQQIPLHTYPIPKHIGETVFSPTSIKTEPNLQPYPPFGEAHDKDEHYRGAVNEESPTGLVQAKEEAKEMEGLNRPHSNQSCYHQIEKDKTEEIQAKAPTPKPPSSGGGSSRSKKQAQKDIYNERNNKPEVPDCDCFSSEKKPPEPGSYYTHLGCAATLEELRKEIEARTGFSGKQLRIEKVLYTGKEGKSSQGCPIAKWVIRRVDAEEKALFVVKRRQGHRCKAAFVVISIVVWEAMPLIEADNMYKLLVHKLNKFGLPTTRRCATNENRTCACQGLDPETCGASYSFGCSWSMYYNGCKYARSKTVRKFRLSVKSEEAEIEERMNIIATILSPMYKTIAPKAYLNQVQYETEAPDCRLGLKYGKPFSGVTCCVDFCAHTHRDLHNMQDGCTVQATLLKPRPYGMSPEDEQLHVLPLYTMDATDEFDSEEGQKKKHETGAVTVLEKYATEVRVRSTPLQPCRRHGKKRGNGTMGDEEPPLPPPPVLAPPQPITPVPPPVLTPTKDPKSKSRSRSKSSNNSAQLPQPPSIPSQNTQSQQSAFTSPNQLQQQQLQQQQQQQTPPNNNSPSQQTQLPGAPANGNNTSTLLDMASMIDTFTDAQLQSNQISSTVLDSPYSYDYQTGQYIDNRQFHYQWQQDYNKMRAEEISPDTTTRPGSSNSSNNSNSAFSPNIAQQQNQALYESNNNLTGDYGKSQQHHHHHHQQQQQQYHQLETAFVKPKAPAHSYGNYPPHQLLPQHPNNYQLYSTYPYDPYGYNSYGNYSSNYPAYGSMNYGQSAPPQTPNWGLYQNSPMPPSATPVIPPQYPPNFQQQTQLGSPAQQNMSSSPSKMSEALGEVTEINDNLECFQDKQMGGVAIALPHGSVVIECAKLEMHSTTSLKKPNRLNPNRISLIFYQHRNLNRPKHGTLEWAEKMRLKKLGITTPDNDPDLKELLEEDMKQEFMDEEDEVPPPTPKPAKKSRSKKDKHVIEEKISSSVSPKCKSEGPGKTFSHSKSPALTATSWTTLFPMHPCVVTGPYKEGSATDSPPPLEGHQPTTDPLAITKA